MYMHNKQLGSSLNKINSFANEANFDDYAEPVRTLLKVTTGKIHEFILQNLKDYGFYDDRNAIIESTFVNPMLFCLQHGYSESFMLNSEQWMLQYASLFNDSEDSFLKFVKQYHLNGSEPFPIVQKMLILHTDAETANLLLKYDKSDVLLKYLPDWVSTFADKQWFIENVYCSKMPIWYLAGVQKCTREELQSVSKSRGNKLAAIALQSIVDVDYKTFPMCIWVCIDLGNPIYYPCYEFRTIRDGHFQRTQNSIVLPTKNTIFVVRREFGVSLELPDIPIDSPNPVRDYCNSQCIKFGLGTDFSDEQCYLGIFPAIVAVSRGQSDWLIYLKNAKLFPTVIANPNKSFIQTLLNMFMCVKLHDCTVDCGMVKIDNEIMSVPEAFFDIRTKQQSEVCYVGTKNSSISCNDYCKLLSDRMRQQ